MIASIAQGLHLSIDERDHVFRLAGHQPPERGASSEHVSPGLLRILDRLNDTPAEIVSELGETLRQSPLGVALTGDTARLVGPARSIGFRWFTDPASRELYAPEDHPFLSRLWVSGLRGIATLRGRPSRAAHLVEVLLEQSAEFRTLWEHHEVGLRPREVKHFRHPELGALELACQTLIDPAQSHSLLVYTAEPGTESAEKLQLLSVIGAQRLS
jgi:hypothetical protein